MVSCTKNGINNFQPLKIFALKFLVVLLLTICLYTHHHSCRQNERWGYFFSSVHPILVLPHVPYSTKQILSSP